MRVINVKVRKLHAEQSGLQQNIKKNEYKEEWNHVKEEWNQVKEEWNQVKDDLIQKSCVSYAAC